MLVGIFSYNKYSLYMNFGAALHSFAFQKALEKEGIESHIVDYRSKHVENFDFNHLAVTNFKTHKSIKSFLFGLINGPSLKKKYKKFQKFYNDNCIMFSDNGLPFKYSSFINNEYKHFPFTSVVCESDVTWSPLTNKGFDRVLFFDFDCFSNINKVAYSPSISNTILNNDQEQEFKVLLENYDHLSSREDETAKYVEKLTGRTCHWVLDPVLLLSKEEYCQYIEEMPYKNFVVVYNCMKNDKNLLLQAQKYADEKGLKLIEISDFSQNKIKYNHEVLTDLGIGEFLYMFKNAECIFTNGFHGACFSIVFNRDFYLFARDGFDIKIKSLLKMFDLNNRFVDFNSGPKNQESINYDKVNKILDIEISHSMKYIREALV
ncbi:MULTISPECIES: polysaccharide pyruvyl transferase family protein [unclassified Acinetobacter]|uniref:polysaccharide pyruvyl transferase family protein n=1 Tax=unclassified Acinetobacter TaxID=196816 RepID=UPI0015D10B84|nr:MULTISPECIES: polysaccharide pyruvyl transferase family protein [unclassified Acinetobacter]